MNKKLAKAGHYLISVISNIIDTVITIFTFAIILSLTSITVALCVVWFIIYLLMKIAKNAGATCIHIQEKRGNGKN